MEATELDRLIDDVARTRAEWERTRQALDEAEVAATAARQAAGDAHEALRDYTERRVQERTPHFVVTSVHVLERGDEAGRERVLSEIRGDRAPDV